MGHGVCVRVCACAWVVIVMAPAHSLAYSKVSSTQQTSMNVYDIYVIPSLKTGLMSLNYLAAKVIEAKVPHILRSEAMYADIRTAIKETQKHFGHSEWAANRGLNAIDTHYEELTVTRGTLERQKAAKEAERNIIGLRQQQATQSLRSAEQSHQAAKREYGHALWRLKTAERKMENGLITGEISLSSAREDYGNARYMADKAEDEMTSDNAVKRYSRLSAHYTSRQTNLDYHIHVLISELLQLDYELVKIGMQQDMAAQIQSKMREATNALEGLARANDGAEIETRTYIAVGALIHTVQDIFDLSGRYGLEFDTEEVESLIGSLQRYEDKLKERSDVCLVE